MSVHLKYAMKTAHGVLIILLSFWLVLPRIGFAQEFLPANVSAALIYKVLTYDRSLSERFPEDLRIGVVYDLEQHTEKEFAAKFVAGLKTGKEKFQTRSARVRIDTKEYSRSITPGELRAWIQEKHIGVVVVLSAQDSVLRDVGIVTREAKVNSMCMRRGCLESGIAFGILLTGSKPKMYVNVSLTKEEGSDYSSKLLKLCEQVDGRMTHE